MAQGDLRGTLSGNVTSITNPMTCSGTPSVGIFAGDLIIVVISEEIDLTAGSTPTDNLGNSYTAQNAGSDAGAVSGRAYWCISAFSGTLSSISVSATASTNDAVMAATVYAGPFQTIESNPSNITGDIVAPYGAPALTVTTAPSILIAWISASTATAFTVVGPFVIDFDAGGGGNAHVAIASRLTNTDGGSVPTFTGGGSPTASVIGSMSFPFQLISGWELLGTVTPGIPPPRGGGASPS